MNRGVLIAGGGGVGKTTIAAALGVVAAQSGRRTLVLTVDPARRLADALGLEHLSNEPTPNPELPDLWAAMLDPAASWDALVHRHAPLDVAERLVVNPFFEAVANRFPAGQSYAAAEQMASHLESGEWEAVVVDTPPSEGGIDFFLAPSAMRELVGGRLLRWLTGARIPGRRSIYNLTARPALRLADSVLGGQLLQNVAEFLFDLRATYDGIARRAREIERHFRVAMSLVVTTADPAPLREAMRFYRELPEVARPPAAVVFNRSLPAGWSDPPPPAPVGNKAGKALAENLARWGAEVRRQEDARADFAGRYRTRLAAVPWMPEAPTSLDALARLVAASDGLPLAELGVQAR